MNSTNNSALTKTNINKNLIFIVILIIIAFVFAVLSSSQSLRNYYTLNFTENNQRKILSKIFTKYNNVPFVIFKIRTSSGIDIEFYEKDPQTYYQKLKQKFSFPDDKDSFLIVNGNSVSLALSDIDNDGEPEIVAPTVDQFGLSRLNIFKFDMTLNQFSQTVSNE